MTAKELRIASTLNAIRDGKRITERQLRALEKARHRVRNHCDDPVNRMLLRAIDVAIETVTAPCPGEAHGNPYIDNCMVCAPRWGRIPNERVKRC